MSGRIAETTRIISDEVAAAAKWTISIFWGMIVISSDWHWTHRRLSSILDVWTHWLDLVNRHSWTHSGAPSCCYEVALGPRHLLINCISSSSLCYVWSYRLNIKLILCSLYFSLCFSLYFSELIICDLLFSKHCILVYFNFPLSICL